MSGSMLGALNRWTALEQSARHITHTQAAAGCRDKLELQQPRRLLHGPGRHPQAWLLTPPVAPPSSARAPWLDPCTSTDRVAARAPAQRRQRFNRSMLRRGQRRRRSRRVGLRHVSSGGSRHHSLL